jgi:hypothetical protein
VQDYQDCRVHIVRHSPQYLRYRLKAAGGCTDYNDVAMFQV